MLEIGVQTWGTDVVVLERYWRAADELGYGRVTYGDGLWSFTHDGWSSFTDFPSTRMLKAFAREVRPRLEALSRRGEGRSASPPAV